MPCSFISLQLVTYIYTFTSISLHLYISIYYLNPKSQIHIVSLLRDNLSLPSISVRLSLHLRVYRVHLFPLNLFIDSTLFFFGYSYIRVHTFIHTYIHTSTFIYSYIHIFIHTYIHSYIRVHSFIHTFIHSYIPVSVSSSTQILTTTIDLFPIY